MVASFFTGAAVLLAAIRLVSATGSAVVHNQCDFDVYLWSVSDVSSDMITLAANGGEYTEAYQTNPDGGGISMKVGTQKSGENVTQFEYTLESSSVWYDLSLINGVPFYEYGVTVVPSDSSCSSVSCPAGKELCAEAYMTPTDNWATAECTSDADTVMVLCSGDDDTVIASSVSAIASSAISTASTVTVFASTSATVEATTTDAATSETVETTTDKHGHKTTLNVDVATSTAAAITTSAAAYVADPNVVIHTTFVTYIVTVEERDAAPEPTAAPAKRQIHRHEHGHQQKRHPHGHVA